MYSFYLEDAWRRHHIQRRRRSKYLRYIRRNTTETEWTCGGEKMITEVKNRMMKSEEVFPLLSYSHFKVYYYTCVKEKGESTQQLSVTRLKLAMISHRIEWKNSCYGIFVLLLWKENAPGAVVGRCSGDLLKLNWPDVAPALTIEDTEDLVSKNLEVFWV